MATEKKRPSKRAKAVSKILKNSEPLAAKTADDKPTEAEFNPANVTAKTSAANKLRPDKKRG